MDCTEIWIFDRESMRERKEREIIKRGFWFLVKGFVWRFRDVKGDCLNGLYGYVDFLMDRK